MESFLQWRRLVEKQARYDSHLSFLSKCRKYDRIPDGLQINLPIELDIDNKYIHRCCQIKKDASLKIIEMLIEGTREKCSDLRDEILVCRDRLQNADQCLYENAITNEGAWSTDMRKKCEHTKEKKWVRDLKEKDGTKRAVHKRIKVEADGNCFYRCVSTHLYGTEERHAEIREIAVSHMESHKSEIACYIDGSVNTHIDNQKYTDGRYNSWATEAEIIAVADAYQFDIVVTKTLNPFPTWHTFTPITNVDGSVTDKLYLLSDGSHFDVVQPDADPESRQDFDWFDMSNRGSGNKSKAVDVQRDGQAHADTTSKEWGSTRAVNKSPKGISTGVANRVKNQNARANKKNSNISNSSQQETVTNLSAHTLTENQLRLLTKGLTFVPDRREVYLPKLLADLGEWERRMRLREYFYNEDERDGEEDESERFKVKRKSTFTPKKGRDAWLDMYIEVVKNDIVSGLKKAKSLNLSKAENEALNEMLHNQDIVIRPADKGSGIVVMNKADYVSGLMKEMESSDSYIETEEDCTEHSLKAVKKLVNRMYREDKITKDMQQYLIPRYSRAGRLKGNPKIHKTGAPMRTIVNGIGTPTEKLAEVAEYELNEFVVGSPSYIQDTTDFLQKLSAVSQPLPEGTLLFCFDVTKLYPSVPRDEGLEACREGLASRSKPIIPTDEVLNMIQVVLDNNNFQMLDRNYTQTEGIAIGSRLGKKFACAYMRVWDRLLLKCEKKPFFYKRFIDDGFGLWTEGEESLKAFADHANKIHRNIKVELRYSRSQIEFLDTMVRLQEGVLVTDLYSKPSDKHLYLNSTSNHPPHTKKSLPYGLGIRLKRICKTQEDYTKRRRELKIQLRKRGYSGKLIEKQLQKVDKKDRSDLLNYRQRGDKMKRVPLVVTYSKNLPDVHNVLHRHMSLLHRSERMRKVFEEEPMAAYRRDRSLQDILVHGKLKKDVKSPEQVCKADCRTCTVLTNGGCKYRDVIYEIKCSRCERAVYVGETGRELRERVEEHLRDIRLRYDKPVAGHFNNNGHSIRDVEIRILERLYDQSKDLRQIKESEWIERLNTRFPSGVNTRERPL